MKENERKIIRDVEIHRLFCDSFKKNVKTFEHDFS